MRDTFLGCPIDILTMSETVDLARDAMRTRKRLRHVALNVAKLVTMRRDPLLAADVKSSDVVGVDGMGIVWSARFLGLPIRDRVAGIDLLNQLLEVCADEGLKPYFLGATRETVNEAVRQILKKHPEMRFAELETVIFLRNRKSTLSTKSGRAVRIVYSSACPLHARNGFLLRIATKLTFRLSWGLAARSTFSLAKSVVLLHGCNSWDSNGCIASIKNRVGCGGDI